MFLVQVKPWSQIGKTLAAETNQIQVCFFSLAPEAVSSDSSGSLTVSVASSSSVEAECDKTSMSTSAPSMAEDETGRTLNLFKLSMCLL